MRASFASFQVAGLPRLREAVASGPVLVVSNHTAWWDALVVLVLLSRVLGVDGYAMMDARNLRRLPFFGLVGGFGVDRRTPGDGEAAIQYAAGLLSGPGRVVWMFPQGAERRAGVRPLGFKPGSALIARARPEARVVPVALRYEHAHRERPELYLSVGELHVDPGASPEAHREAQERAVTALLDTQEASLQAEDEAGFERLWDQSEPWGARLATAALAWLSGRALARRG